MKANTNAFDSNALGRAIAMQILLELPPTALEKVKQRIRARRALAQDLSTKGAHS
ncbi:MAG: hypothetical protein ACK4L8_08600 [Nitrincola lacisaponensis]|uniref:hypothetical protein n=1 Tax=Nitrincola lacisaponensis TaxID=267850 RepID=UPI00391963D0